MNGKPRIRSYILCFQSEEQNLSSISATNSVSPIVSSLLFSKAPLTAAQQQYLSQNYSITETASNTEVTKQANGMLLVGWHGSSQLASSSSGYSITYDSPNQADAQSSPTNSPNKVAQDKSPSFADAAKVISAAANRNEDFSLLDTFFNPTTSTTSGVNNQESQRIDRKA